jgi:peptidoglycan/LPS O-acetylase OafA/YrhL
VQETATLPSPPPGRFRSLDGLRGVAALIVVFHHSLLALPAASNMVAIPPVGSSLWWLEYTPLKLLTAGNEAVLIFFVLSGFVLALPVLRSRSYDWVAYYFRRTLRLYLPVVASIALAAVVIYAHPQRSGNGSSWVDGFSVGSPTWGLFLKSLDIFEPSNLVNNPLWTLRWEMIFSLALPLFVFGALLVRRHWVLVLLGAVVLVVLGTFRDVSFLLYLPVFFCGSVLAVNADRLLDWSNRIRGRRGVSVAWLVLLLGGLALLIAHWLLQPFLLRAVVLDEGLLGLSFVGAVIIVAVAFLWRPFESALMIAPVRWLGRVSFSLYLVHVPIIIACANIFGRGNWPLTVAVAVPVSLVVAELFARFVEQPAHRLSKRVGSAVSAHVLTVSGDKAGGSARADSPAQQGRAQLQPDRESNADRPEPGS